MTKRAIASLVLLIAILFLPFWIYLPLLAIAIILVPFFWEGLLFAILIDTLYGNSFNTAIIATLLIAVLIPFRERFRTYV